MVANFVALLAVAFAPSALRPALTSPRARNGNGVARIFCAAADNYELLDATIDELLAERKPERLPSLLGRRLEVLTDGRFLPRIEERCTVSAPYEVAELKQLGNAVVDFLEEVTQRVLEIEPGLAAVEAEADEITSKAAKAAEDARAADPTSSSCECCPPSAPPHAAEHAHSFHEHSHAPAAPPPPGTDMLAEHSHEHSHEHVEFEPGTEGARARKRFLLEDLLGAAKIGVDRLDAVLMEKREELDVDFFAHLEWEVAEQKRVGNRKLLSILEVVVQRACLEVEGGQTEVALLSALLQTHNQLQRREMYERELGRVADGTRIATRLVALVTDTQLMPLTTLR